MANTLLFSNFCNNVPECTHKEEFSKIASVHLTIYTTKMALQKYIKEIFSVIKNNFQKVDFHRYEMELVVVHA